MFESREYPKALDEALFEQWLEAGRESKMSYEYMLVVWDDLEADYHPEYAASRVDFEGFPKWGNSSSQSALIAVYHLYSESRVM